MNTTDATLPPLDPAAPKRKMVIEIEVAADFEKRLDNQWMVEREINADRWTWRWADGTPMAGERGDVEAVANEIAGGLLSWFYIARLNRDFTAEDKTFAKTTILAALTPLLDRREGEASNAEDALIKCHAAELAGCLAEQKRLGDLLDAQELKYQAEREQWRLSSVCREKGAELAALRTLVAKQGEAASRLWSAAASVVQESPETAQIYQELDAALNRWTAAKALTPSAIADELAAKDALIAALRDQVEVRGQMRDEAIEEMNKTEQALRESEAARGEDRERLLNVARGCHDYGGGYREPREAEIFHHGIQTVINSLEAFSKNPNDTQTLALERAARAQEASASDSEHD